MPTPQIFYKIGYAICHQLPRRTLCVHDKPLPLCSRCTGIYLGAFLTVSFYFIFKRLRGQRPSKPPALPIIILSTLFFVAMPFNALSPMFGVPTHNIARFITGILFGFSIPLFLLPAFNFSTKRRNDEHEVIKGAEYVILFVLVTVISVLVIIGNALALYFAAYASVAGLIILVTLLNATIVRAILEQRETIIKGYWAIAIGLMMTVGELSLFYYARGYIEWLILG